MSAVVSLNSGLFADGAFGYPRFITGSRLTDGMTTVVQFLDMVLNGSQTARAHILSPSGPAAKAPWSVSTKNF